MSDVVHVPFKRGGSVLAAAMSGKCDVSFHTPLAPAGQIIAGWLHAPAVTSRNGLALLPHVAIVAESIVPNYEFLRWVSDARPALTPLAIVKVFNERIVKAVRTPASADASRASVLKL